MKGLKTRDINLVESLLNDVVTEFEALIKKAEDYKESKSEKWCESDAGEAYENRIERLSELCSDAETLCEEFTNLMNEE